MEEDTLYKQLHTVQERLRKADIVIVMDDLNTKVGSYNALLERVMGKHSLGNRNDNGETCVDFYN